MNKRTVPDHAYRTLGVSRDDDFATIRRTWLKRVRALYPSVLNGDDTEAATTELAALNDAYDALCWHRSPRAPEAPQPGTPTRRQRPRSQPAPRSEAPVLRLEVMQEAAPREALDRFASARGVFVGQKVRTLRHA